MGALHDGVIVRDQGGNARGTRGMGQLPSYSRGHTTFRNHCYSVTFVPPTVGAMGGEAFNEHRSCKLGELPTEENKSISVGDSNSQVKTQAKEKQLNLFLPNCFHNCLRNMCVVRDVLL